MAKAAKAPTTEELEAILKANKTLLAQTEEQMNGWRADILRLNGQLATAGKTRGNLEQRIVEITNTLFVRAALQPELLAARSTYLKQVRCERSDKISVRKQRELHAGNTMAFASLQADCTHPFVFSYDGYGGSHSMDNDDAYCGHRVCTLCNLHETSQRTSIDVYSTLVEDGTRLVRRDLRDNKRDRFSNEEWFPTEFLQQLFEASAGDMNIRWPKEIPPDAVYKV